MANTKLIKTGIDGLDAVFLGGILHGNVILVQGAAGTGKTLMGMEFIYRGITEHNEPGMIVGFEVSPDKLIRDAANFGWKLEELQQRKKLKIILTSPRVFEQELRSADSLLLETAAEIGARRIFIDGVGLLRPPPPQWPCQRREPGGKRAGIVPRVVATGDRVVKPGEPECYALA